MNSALVTALGVDDAVIEKTRVTDDHVTIWAEIDNWLKTEGVLKIKVERFDPHDECQQCYEVTPVD